MFVKGVISLSEKVFKNSIGKPSGPGALLFGRDFIASRTSFSDILASRMFLSSGSNLGKVNELKNVVALVFSIPCSVL